MVGLFDLPTDSDDPQPIVANIASSTDIAMQCSDCSDPLLLAMHKLETIASKNGFTIHDVPADGDCMYSAIVYQLSSIGIHVDSQILRQKVADYLRANKASYGELMAIMQTLWLPLKRMSTLLALLTPSCKQSFSGKNT